MRFNLGGSYRVSAKQFWSDVFFVPDFVDALHLDGLEYQRIEIVDQAVAPDGARERTLLAYPSFEIPGPLKRVLGSEIHYREEGRFNPVTQVWTTVTTLPRLGDKLRVTTEMSFVDIGPGRSQRAVDIEVRVRLFGLGRIVERFVKHTIIDAYEQARIFTNDWTDKHLADRP